MVSLRNVSGQVWVTAEDGEGNSMNVHLSSEEASDPAVMAWAKKEAVRQLENSKGVPGTSTAEPKPTPEPAEEEEEPSSDPPEGTETEASMPLEANLSAECSEALAALGVDGTPLDPGFLLDWVDDPLADPLATNPSPLPNDGPTEAFGFGQCAPGLDDFAIGAACGAVMCTGPTMVDGTGVQCCEELPTGEVPPSFCPSTTCEPGQTATRVGSYCTCEDELSGETADFPPPNPLLNPAAGVCGGFPFTEHPGASGGGLIDVTYSGGRPVSCTGPSGDTMYPHNYRGGNIRANSVQGGTEYSPAGF